MPRWLINVWVLGGKELTSLARDVVLLGFLVYSFTMMVATETRNAGNELVGVRVTVLDEDRSDLSTAITQALLPPTFALTDPMTAAEADRALGRGMTTFVLVIPPRFEADLLSGRDPELQLLIDATVMTQAAIGDGYIQQIVGREITAALAAGGVAPAVPVTLSPRSAFNPNLDSARKNAIASLIQQITILSVLLVGAAVMREREHGTIEHLLVMPVRASEIAAAKIWANALVVLGAAIASLLLVVEAGLGVPLNGSLPLFVAGTALFLFAMNAIGLLIATVARSMPQFGLLATPVFIVLMMLSGSVAPVSAMPEAMQLMLHASPAVHFADLATAILARGAPLTVVWPDFAALAAIWAAAFALALVRFRAMLAKAG